MKSITRTHLIRVITFLQRAMQLGVAAVLLTTNLGIEWPGEITGPKPTQTVSSIEASWIGGRIMPVRGAPETVVVSYEKFISPDARSAPYAAKSLARTFIQRERLNEAITLSEKAVAQQPDVASFQHHLGIALQHTGNFHKALKVFQAALTIDPNYVKAQISLNEVQKQLRLKDEYPSAMPVAE